MQVELFGDDRGFLPMNLNGALGGDEELLQMLREFPSFHCFPPNDSHGRTIVFTELDYSNENFNNHKPIVKV